MCVNMERGPGGELLTHEEVVRIWIGAANLKELHQVVKLAVYIAAYCDWTFLGND